VTASAAVLDPAWGQRIGEETNRWGRYVPRETIVKCLPSISDPSEALLEWSREFCEGLADRPRLDALRRRYELAARGTPCVVTYQIRESDEEYAQRRYVNAGNPNIQLLPGVDGAEPSRSARGRRGGTHLSAHAKLNMAAARVKSARAHSRTYYRRKRKQKEAQK
jgi:hypothetical protein